MMNTKALHIRLTMLVPLFMTLVFACDKIDEPMLIINVQDIPDKIPDTVFFSDSLLVNRRQVLLEEFTGHFCVNCPEAAIQIHQVAVQHDHQLIIYSVHAGFYAITEPSGHYNTDFTCQAGNEIFDFFNEPFNPTATVNRVSFNGNRILLLNAWENAFLQEAAKPNVVEVKVKNTWFPNLERLLIEVESRFISQVDGKYRLVVVIAEDHIISPQKNNKPALGPTPDWLDYEHRNILRDAITPVFGSYLTADGSINAGETYTATFFYAPDENWEISNCNIIAYIYHEESLDIIQVAELGIKTSE